MHPKYQSLSVLLTIALLWFSSIASGEITITHPEIRETADNYMVNAEFFYALGDDVIDADFTG